MYKVIGHPQARTVRVLWALEEMGLDYELVPATPQSEGILAVNPSGKVPALIVEDHVLTDSVAILYFLSDRHKQLTEQPGSLKRARMDSFVMYALDELDAPLWALAKSKFALPEKYRVPNTNIATEYEFAKAQERLEAQIGSGLFAMGEDFTIADIVIGHCASWGKNRGLDWRAGPVSDYFHRVLERPALARARASGGT
jgi:glutathione S-transferase